MRLKVEGGVVKLRLKYRVEVEVEVEALIVVSSPVRGVIL